MCALQHAFARGFNRAMRAIVRLRAASRGVRAGGRGSRGCVRAVAGPRCAGRAFALPAMPSAHPPVPAAVLARLNAICLGLPEAWEENAWTGVRWMVAKKNFAHAVQIEGGWPPAYAQAAGSDGPATVLTFRLPPARVAAARFRRAPFFRPRWFADIAGVFVEERSDWDEIADLLADSYCVLAPKKLVALLDRAPR